MSGGLGVGGGSNHGSVSSFRQINVKFRKVNK